MTSVAVTTAPDRSEELASELESVGLDPVLLPCIAVAPEADDVLAGIREAAARAEWLVVTSPRTVTTLWPLGGMPAVRVAAVGSATSATVTRAGGSVEVVGGGGARELSHLLAPMVPGSNVLVLTQRGRGDAIVSALSDAGATVASRTVYAVEPIAPSDDHVDVVAFSSPSAVSGWHLSRDLDNMVVAAVGQTTASSLVERGTTPDVVPATPGYGNLARAIDVYVHERSLL